MNELYKQEVLELTELLSNDEDSADLRDILIEKNIIDKYPEISVSIDMIRNEGILW